MQRVYDLDIIIFLSEGLRIGLGTKNSFINIERWCNMHVYRYALRGSHYHSSLLVLFRVVSVGVLPRSDPVCTCFSITYRTSPLQLKARRSRGEETAQEKVSLSARQRAIGVKTIKNISSRKSITTGVYRGLNPVREAQVTHTCVVPVGMFVFIA